MTSIEKAQSKKAKSYNRFSGTQDHGSRQESEGRSKKVAYADGYAERQWAERGAVNTDKTYLKEVIRDGLVSEATPAELELEANRILAAAESDRNVESFESLGASAEDYYEDIDESYTVEELQVVLDGLKEQLSRVPQLSETPGYEPVNSQRLRLEGEIDAVIAEIRDMLNEHDYPEAALGQESDKEFNKRMARAATLDYDYSQDDYGDKTYKHDSHVNIRTAPKK